jgi:uncharacterized protein
MFFRNIKSNLLNKCASLLLALIGFAHPSLAGDDSLRIPGVEKPLSWLNLPSSYSATDTGIEIVAGEKTDKYIAPDYSYAIDNAPRVVFDADKDFVFSANIQHPFTNKWDGGSIVLEADRDNWIKFCFEKDYTGAKRVVSVVTKGISDDANSIELTRDSARFKMAKKGDTVYLYVGKSEKDWFLVRAINFKYAKSLKLGLLAQSPEGKTNKVIFTNVQYSAKTIKDFWTGE